MKMLHAAAVGVLLFAGRAAWAQSDAQKALEKLKSLVGTWQGKTVKGESVEDSYRLTAGGTAVMGEDKMATEDMLSLFYVDGDRLLMTHFCPSGNQPRMQASASPDGDIALYGVMTRGSSASESPSTCSRVGPCM